MSVIDDQLNLDPATSLPRSNGELVFEEPWESRAFGMAAALADLGTFEWGEFQSALIAAIAECEDGNDDQQVYRYYERWLGALETLVISRGLVSAQDLDERITQFSCRPAGHDHDHDHGVGHKHDH